MLMMLARFRGFGTTIAADAHDAGPGYGVWPITIAADAHDAGLVPEFGPTQLQLMLMMLAWFRNLGQNDCS